MAVLFVVTTGAVLVAVYYLVNMLLRIERLKGELNWLSGPSVIAGTLSYVGVDQISYVELLRKAHAQYGSIHKNWIGIHPVINVADPALMQALSNTGKSANKSLEYKFFATFCGNSLLTSSGDIWFRKRKLVTPCFHYEVLNTFLAAMNEHAKKFTEHLSKFADNGQSFDFVHIIKLCTLDILMETTMGITLNALENEDNEYVQAVGSMRAIVMARAASPFIRNDFFYNLSWTKKLADKTVNTINNFVSQVIRTRKEERANNKSSDVTQQEGKRKKALLDMFLDMNEFLDKEMEDDVNTFMFAGHDTTSVAISFMVYLMGRHPDIQERVYQELNEKIPNLMENGFNHADLNKLEYMERCIKESLRLYPPVPLIGKSFKQPLKTDLGTIPAGVNVIQHIYGMHNDEKLYPEPSKYDPDRFLPDAEGANKRHPYAYIPFGSGSRNCIGQRFAQNELKVILAYLIVNYKIESLQTPEELRIGYDVVLCPFNGVNIKIHRR